MSIIKNIGNLPPEFRKTERNEKQSEIRRPADVSVKAPAQAEKVPTNSTDQVNVSDSAKTLFQRDAEIQKFTAELPNVDTLSSEEKREIEAKIDSGFYSTPEVTSYVAGKLVDESQPMQKSISPVRMQEVIEKIRSNEYDSQGVLDIIADKIIKDLER